MCPVHRTKSWFTVISSHACLLKSTTIDIGDLLIHTSLDGVSSFQDRLQNSDGISDSITLFPSSPPGPVESSRRYEAETPSKRVKRTELYQRNEDEGESLSCVPLTSGLSEYEAQQANLGLTGLGHLLSNLSMEQNGSRSANDASLKNEHPFTRESLQDHTLSRFLNASSPDVDADGKSDKVEFQGRNKSNITSANAQSILLPQACVFAAK